MQLWEGYEKFKVVLNDEEQYSIWPDGRANAPGWKDEGKIGTKDECLAHIKEVWTDLRPLSLRKAMAVMNGDAVAFDTREPNK